jgi:ATP-binding protein involved in chromosome partitioning
MTEAILARARELIARRIDPVLEQDLVSAGALRDLALADGTLHLTLRFGFPVERYAREIEAELGPSLAALEGVERVRVDTEWDVESRAVQPGLQALPGIRNFVAVASG